MATARDGLDVQHYAWLARSFGRTDYLLLSPDDLAAVGAAGTEIVKYPGTHLFREGAQSDAAYIIREGTVELYRGYGPEAFVVARAGVGSVIGDIAVFRNEPYIQSARAVDSVTALRLDRNRLLPVLLERPVIALRWLVSGLSQLEKTQRRVLGLMQRSVREQVVGLLSDEADEHGEVHLSQSAIARLLGTSRQSVNEALSDLRRDGLVATGYRNIRILSHPQGPTVRESDRRREASRAHSSL